MRKETEFLVKVILLGVIWFAWGWAIKAPLAKWTNLSIIVGGWLLVFPLVWLGRQLPGRGQRRAAPLLHVYRGQTLHRGLGRPCGW